MYSLNWTVTKHSQRDVEGYAHTLVHAHISEETFMRFQNYMPCTYLMIEIDVAFINTILTRNHN